MGKIVKINLIVVLTLLALASLVMRPVIDNHCETRSPVAIEDLGNPDDFNFGRLDGRAKAVDPVSTGLTMFTWLFSAIKTGQPQYLEKSTATVNVVAYLPPSWVRESGKRYLVSGWKGPSVTIHPLVGLTGSMGADGRPEYFPDFVDIQVDAGISRPVDWAEVTLDGELFKPDERAPDSVHHRDYDTAVQQGNFRSQYRRIYRVPIAGIQPGFGRVFHWRSSKEKGEKPSASVYIEPITLAELYATNHLGEFWQQRIETRPFLGDPERTAPVVFQAVGVGRPREILVYDTLGVEPNSPRRPVAKFTLDGTRAETIWVKPGLVFVQAPDSNGLRITPAPTATVWGGRRAYDFTGVQAPKPGMPVTPVILKLTNGG